MKSVGFSTETAQQDQTPPLPGRLPFNVHFSIHPSTAGRLKRIDLPNLKHGRGCSLSSPDRVRGRAKSNTWLLLIFSIAASSFARQNFHDSPRAATTVAVVPRPTFGAATTATVFSRNCG